MLKTQLALRIDWADLDLFGHVNNVMFFKYMQASRLHHCELFGLTSLNDSGQLSFIVASSKCDFVKPLRYPGNLEVHTQTGWIKNSSFQLVHTILDGMGEVAAEGEDILVLFDYSRREKMPISEALRSRMAG